MNTDQVKTLNQKPLINNNIELEFEQFFSHWGEYNDNLAHILSDLKIGNLSKRDGSREQVEHCINWATNCKTWHPNPKYRLIRSELGWLSQAATKQNVSLSVDGFFIREGHTIREKQHQLQEQKKKGFTGLPGFGKQQEETF